MTSLLALLVPLALAGKKDDEIAALEAKVRALEAQVQVLEAQVKTLQGGAAAADEPASAAEEEAAQEIYTEINALLEAGQYEEARAKVLLLEARYPNTKTAKRASRISQELAVIGVQAPEDWRGRLDTWFQGEGEVDLREGLVIAVFWESWCPHCQRALPELNATFQRYQDRGLEVVGFTKITRSSTSETVRAFLAEESIAYPIAKEDGSLSELFNVSGIPAAAVMRDGEVIWRGHPGRITDAMIESWLAGK